MSLVLVESVHVHDPATGKVHREPMRMTTDGVRRGGQTSCGLLSETWNQRLGVAVDCDVCEAIAGLP